jgi:arabinose-5-phosphate isomerase
VSDFAINHAGADIVRDAQRALMSVVFDITSNGRFTAAVNSINAGVDRGGNIILTGVGKSGMVAHRTASSFASVGLPAYYLHAGDAVHGDCGLVKSDDVVVAFTHSGTTDEIVRLIEHIEDRHIVTVVITGNRQDAEGNLFPTHTLGYKADDLLGVMPTSSAVAQAAYGDALLAALIHVRELSSDDFAVNHPGGALGKRLSRS